MSLNFLDTCFDVWRRHRGGVETAATELDYPADDTPPLSWSSDTDFEATCYYCGLPSRPILVYQTGTPWKMPTGYMTYPVLKEARPVFNHAIVGAWDELGPQVPEYLDFIDIMWTTIDLVRSSDDENEPGPPILWIGVKPGSLSREDDKVVAIGCEGLLKKSKLTDVEVAFRNHSTLGWLALSSSNMSPPQMQLLKYAVLSLLPSV